MSAFMPSPEFVTDMLLPLAVAAAVGLTLGLERELSRKPAGLRTQFLVTLGTAIFVLAGGSIPGMETGRVAANVVTGLGFLGAGVILQLRGTVRGLTTAALIWVNGALGLAAATKEYILAGVGVGLALAALRVLALIEKRLGEKWRILEYQITTYENENVIQAVYDALSKCRFQEGPLAFQRAEGTIRMHISFCDTPTRHREFMDRLRRMSDVTEIRAL
ncbi:MgtC/SapB family protein [Sphingopyxis sp. SE2]|uniref:MgtC/SapB family protein n=1 Tax=Sphingopyxis sp. SE2 TaxID=1586240 RepID=UPI0028C25BF5|nr:MgtC/SapB family protein [Sphingopyxis sp. SE2]MDT7531470.1 MgtC/SapB family protein [Sphingopyxis sp. SE2]